MISFKELELDTNNFQIPASYIRNTNLDFSAVYEAPSKTLEEMSSQKLSNDSYKKSLRIYVDGEAREDLTEYILNNPPSSFSELEKWGEEKFKDQDFLVILNRVEKWNDSIVTWCDDLFKDAKGQINDELLHLEVTYFIGNTTYTPFGVHIDEISDALHLNLGPHNRYMYLWDPEVYKKLRGSSLPLTNPDNNFLAHSNRHLIQPDNWFFLPASKYYHIGENNDFTVSLAIALIKYDEDTLLQKICSSNKQESNIDLSIIVKRVLEEEFHREDGIIPLREISQSTEDQIKEVTKYILRIRSNLGFRVPTNTNTNDASVLSNWEYNSYSINQPFKILTLETDEEINLFARGNTISLIKNNSVIEIVRQLNLGKNINAAYLREQFGDYLSEKSFYSIISNLYKCGVIQVHELDENKSFSA
ncbi:hypothetical protein [Pontibacillus salipaludis]|uniref:JmjC domain-containing protein n=1 Tax=Pontibacillus salipaludis TaxID=1697394 RepID=A0ABQ1QM16_9BACI|nr:hypothetical protein [Pontibacillus salipaludis]GGD29585.1 hypothetical protein GCM10011389_41420 [Pontibacillus salipaludis]